MFSRKLWSISIVAGLLALQSPWGVIARQTHPIDGEGQAPEAAECRVRPRGIRDGERLSIGPGERLDMRGKFLDARILKIQLDAHRTEAYLHCDGFARRTVLELLFGEEILQNPDAQRYCIIDGLLDSRETLGRIHRLNVGFDLEADGDGIYATFAENSSVSPDSPRRIYYLGHLGREFSKNPAVERQGRRGTVRTAIDMAHERGRADAGNFAARMALKSLSLLRESVEECSSSSEFFLCTINSFLSFRDMHRWGTSHGFAGGTSRRLAIGDGSKCLRGGFFLGYLFGDLSHSSPAIWVGRCRLWQDSLAGTAFCSYESSDGRRLKSSLDAHISLGKQWNLVRIGGVLGGQKRYGGTAFSVDCRGMRNIVGGERWQAGPWASASYRRASGQQDAPDGSAAGELVRATVGWGSEWENGSAERPLRICGSIGCGRQWDHGGMALGKEGAILSASLDLQKKFSGRWELDGHLNCDRDGGHLSLSLGCAF
ncbi:MAG: hypothetical protein LBB14_01745 [Puniceicoccales bacterium]|jgi:hypothetical protein|nr:hypothetical protein [Puniceicoccales bacterium]